jgi:hypothetical protein
VVEADADGTTVTAEDNVAEVELATEDSIEAAEDRDKLVTEAIGAAVEVCPRPREIERSMTPLSASVDEADEEMNPETGFGSFGSIGAVGTAEAISLEEPKDQ